MALGGIILYLQNQNSGGGGSNIVEFADSYSLEIRTLFPLPTDTVMPPTELSGALLTLSNGALGGSYLSLWYEKSAVSSQTGTIFLTSSAGRLELTAAPIFDGRFYNMAIVKNRPTGSITLHVDRFEEGRSVYSSSSFASSGSTGYPVESAYSMLEVGSANAIVSRGEFWAQEVRLWRAPLSRDEITAHAAHFESYGREITYGNGDLTLHWRLNDGIDADQAGQLYLMDSTRLNSVGTGSNFAASGLPFDKFLNDYAYIAPPDHGWNQEKVRTYSGSTVDPRQAYHDERFVALEFNLYDALNQDISHLMASFDELNLMLGMPVNRYRASYEGLQQVRENYFKRLQSELRLCRFVDMLDFFDSSFISVVQRLLPARSIFKGDEIVVESHMLERPKFQYKLRPIREGIIDISGSITVIDREEDW